MWEVQQGAACRRQRGKSDLARSDGPRPVRLRPILLLCPDGSAGYGDSTEWGEGLGIVSLKTSPPDKLAKQAVDIIFKMRCIRGRRE